MSGFVSNLSSAANLVNAFSSLFGGYGSVTLGPVTFTGQEVPDRIDIGGAQALKMHKLPGGSRVVDVMGRDDAALSWGGIMLGPGAEQRMLSIDAIRTSGQPITLAFGTSSYTVVVSEFKGGYRRTNWCEYSITCEVVQDNSIQANSILPTSLQQITGDMAAALNSIPPGLTAVLTAVTGAQTALAVTGALNQKTAAFSAASTLLGSAQTGVTAAIATAGTALGGLAGATGILGTTVGFGQTGATIANLGTAVTSSLNTGALVTAGGYLERTTTNLASGVTTGLSDIL